MPRKFTKNKSGQTIIEYSLIIILVLTGVMVLGPYVVRSWNAVVKGYDDAVQDSYNDPLDSAPPGGIVTNCSCAYRPPCDTPPCCGMGGCELTEDSEIEFCTPLGCGGSAPNCTTDAGCCAPPVPRIAPDNCGAGPCSPDQLLADVTCGSSTSTVCVDSIDCVNQCMAGAVPVDFDTFEADSDFYFGRCPLDDVNLSSDTVYTTIFFDDCSPGAGTNPKCELQCARGMVPTSSNTFCDCPPPIITTDTLQVNVLYVDTSGDNEFVIFNFASGPCSDDFILPNPICPNIDDANLPIDIACMQSYMNTECFTQDPTCIIDWSPGWPTFTLRWPGDGFSDLLIPPAVDTFTISCGSNPPPYPAGAPQSNSYSSSGCASCPFGFEERCNTLNPTQCDGWCIPDPLWRNTYTWNTTAGGGWQCPGGASANPGCIDEISTVNNEKPFCSGGYLIPGGNHNWSMHAVEGGLCPM